ncbi:MAG: beta-lactamase family protein [Candidatus Lokiarchaeota archaeon]|nr:beta-lactamase family protein [Candidatus Lokiarchaeota archaeon]
MTNKVEIHGLCEPRFDAVKDAFTRNFEEGMEVGATFAVTINGKYVIDIWGGYKDKEKTQPWEKDTICNVYSTTKVPTVLCTMMCVDRGLLDLDEKVAKYWPEFAQNGKENILVRQILSHTSGLAGFEEALTTPSKYLYDWEKATSLLAAQKPWWEPGTKSGYHAITHGYLLGEIVRRVTGKSLGTFFKEEITDLLNIDFHIGLAEKHVPRVTKLIPDKPIMEYIPLIMGGLFRIVNDSEIVKKEIESVDKKIVLDYGDDDQFSVIISNGKIEFKTGKIENPDCRFTVTKDRAGAMNGLFSSLNEEQDYISENLKMVGTPEDLDQVKKLFELFAIEARKSGGVGIKMAIPGGIRDRSGDRDWQAAEIPAANGHGNARSVAKIASIIACEGELNGKRFISKETLEKILEEQIYGRDLVMPYPLRWGLGVGLPVKERPSPNPRTCWWGGAGGSAIRMDLDDHIGFGYVMNKMRNQTLQETAKNMFHSDTRGNNLIKATYESLGLI